MDIKELYQKHKEQLKIKEQVELIPFKDAESGDLVFLYEGGRKKNDI